MSPEPGSMSYEKLYFPTENSDGLEPVKLAHQLVLLEYNEKM